MVGDGGAGAELVHMARRATAAASISSSSMAAFMAAAQISSRVQPRDKDEEVPQAATTKL